MARKLAQVVRSAQEQPSPEADATRQVTLHVPLQVWRDLGMEAKRIDSTNSAIVTQLVVDHLQRSADERDTVARQAERWVRTRRS